jgi:hypothetical protein
MHDEHEERQHNIEIFKTMLGHLGEQEYEQCGRYLAADIYADWPYIPAPGCPESITGRCWLSSKAAWPVSNRTATASSPFTSCSTETN